MLEVKVKKIPLREFKNIYSKVPRFCVDLAIRDRNGAILLSKRDISPDKGWWHFPGGTVLMGETLEDTVQGVAKEELNTAVKVKKLLGVHEYTEGSGLGYPIAAVFLVHPLNKKIIGGRQARLVDYFKDIPEKTLPEVKKFISENFKLS